MWRYLVPISLFAVLAAFFFFGLGLNPGYVPSPLIGKPAPGFELPRLENPAKTISDEVLRGRVALLNVWATWCVGCRQEHAFLNEVARTSGVSIYGLNWKDDRGSALDWLARLGNPYAASAFDETGTVAIDWGVYGAPETFLVGADGTVLFKHIAPLTPEIWHRDFVPLIKAQCGAYPCP
jgi:cytochrome c biogenesis protein CcmG/thiol:disulfide interchange protein DsbE